MRGAGQGAARGRAGSLLTPGRQGPASPTTAPAAPTSPHQPPSISQPHPGWWGAAHHRMARNVGLSSWPCGDMQGDIGAGNTSLAAAAQHRGLADFGRVQGEQAKADASPRVSTMPPTLLCPSLPCTTSRSNLHLCRAARALYPCCVPLPIPVCPHVTPALFTTLRPLTKAERPSRHRGPTWHRSPVVPKRSRARSIGPQHTSRG